MTFRRLWGKLRYPQTTARSRLTLLYGGMFLVCGAALLAVTYALVSSQITGGRGIELPPARARMHAQAVAPVHAGGAGGRSSTPSGGGRAIGLPPPDLKMPTVPAAVARVLNSSAGQEFLRLVETQQRVKELHQLEIESAIALGVMTILSGLLGWLVAGRVLRPLRTIIAATRKISETSLDRRLALSGPRDELRTLADTIDGLLARLEAAFESQRRFVANASHELRTPLTTMRAALDVSVAKPHASVEITALDASLREDLDQADRLLESFMVLARAQRGQLGEETPVSLAHVVGGALASHRKAIAAKQIALETTLAPACVDGSQTLLTRMVDNLIDNAVRHNLANGSISVTCGADVEAARLVVESDGSVLDQDVVSRLAEPFRRLGAERLGSQDGHGLGLSIVAAIAAAHGGKLRLYARDRGGLGAEVTLPVAPGGRAAIAPA